MYPLTTQAMAWLLLMFRRLVPRHIAQMISGAMFGVAQARSQSACERDSESYPSAKPEK